MSSIFPYGYDERQYCSPGFDLPIGLFQRSQFGTFPEYHTSADNLNFIHPIHLEGSFHLIERTLGILEKDRKLVNLFPKGEPQLARRGLYSRFGSGQMRWLEILRSSGHSICPTANIPCSTSPSVQNFRSTPS